MKLKIKSWSLISVLCFSLMALNACSSNNLSPEEVMQATWSKTINAGTVYMLAKLQLHNVTIIGAPKNALSLITSPNEQMGGIGEFYLKDNDGSFTLDTPNFGSIELDILQGSFYMHFPGVLLGTKLGQKPWLYVDSNTLGSLKNPALVAIAQLFIVMDPAYSLNYLKNFSGPVSIAGKSKVSGVTCTLYNYTINIEQAASNWSGVTKAVLLEASQVLHTNMQNVTSCIDSSGIIRSNAFTINLNNVSYPVPGAPTNTEKLQGSMTITQLFNQYKQVSFITKAPPSNQVENIHDFAQLLALS